MDKITIAIDGFSSTGKSTVAKRLAATLGYIYVDSGAMYRAVTLYAMNNGYIGEDYFDEAGLIAVLHNIDITFHFNEELGFAEVFLNDINVEKQIRTLEVSRFVSQIATVSDIREKMVLQQQRFGKDKGVVMDGRDIGTVVFPHAELKLFMIATAEKRAQRRYDELIARGDEVDYEDVLQNVQSRDHIDSTRADSPLTKADDAVEIDNSEMTLEEQFEIVYQYALQKINKTT
ncbi:(d)CMP kinase [Psychroserpens sp.]|uniref:(d)CMP kinase n=1 Tax=Psychroserpens sp. TaxID=2020870 RepID=UPI001B1C785C|nr:(d)CMP kinase [Psychroserpens sp.]MBO6607273.1 (d)CMP kinase [Psychroserpens sp.]MBO6632237.1 (d)CMP kinase [Psychroserpens sp.]MBO6654651.1 (d)CMP kinase [Psychroserpens sp.]MBO6681002.1 (d)CMP kinase [Psychroserpens sp.]MBO6750043.1 (d)CMP kinase [Psychroserpens sp.]